MKTLPRLMSLSNTVGEPNRGNFYHEIDSVASGEMSCFMCDLNNKLCPSATCMTCLCLNADGVDVDASLELSESQKKVLLSSSPHSALRHVDIIVR